MADEIAQRRSRTRADVPARRTTGYPAPFRHVVEGRAKQPLGDAFGLTQFGVNLTELAPGAATGLRHWHAREDEFVYVLEGEVVLRTDAGEEVLRPGQFIGYKAGVADGHHIVNRGDRPALILEVGTRDPADVGNYPDDDLLVVSTPEGRTYTRKDGSGY